MLTHFWHFIARILQTANAGIASLDGYRLDLWAQKSTFYAFKDRLLKRFGIADGYDRQDLTYKCRCCNGTGTYSPCGICNFMGPCSQCNRDLTDPCRKCGGSGVFSQRTFWLARYRLGGLIFHIPIQTDNLPLLIHPPVVVFTEKIKHEAVDIKKAWKSALLLFLIFEPWTLGACAMMKLREWKNDVRQYFWDRSIPF